MAEPFKRMEAPAIVAKTWQAKPVPVKPSSGRIP